MPLEEGVRERTKKISKEMKEFRPKGVLALEKMLKKKAGKKVVAQEN